MEVAWSGGGMNHFRLHSALGRATRRAVALFFAYLPLAGCGDSSEPAPSTARSCDRDTDCDGGQICQTLTGAATLAVVAPAPCPYAQCAESAQCGEGNVCAPLSQAPFVPYSPSGTPACHELVCLPACPTRACAADESCDATGQCVVAPCDAEGAPECQASWRCDPAAAPTEALSQSGSNVSDAGSERAVERGCVRKRCDEPDGYVCRPEWRCASDEATDPSGCVPVPCTEGGLCSVDTNICAPTSEKPRPPGVDVNGCVPRNCEEGVVCTFVVVDTDVGVCDFDAPYANAVGCGALACDESDGLCYSGQICDPGAAMADERGCRTATCDEPGALACPAGWGCDPSGAGANPQGCVIVGVDGSGGSGSGGLGTGGAAQGGVGAGGPSTGGGAAPRGGAAGSAGAQGGSAPGSGGSNATGGSLTADPAGNSGTEPGRCVDR